MIDRKLDNLVGKKEKLIRDISRKDAQVKRLIMQQDRRMPEVRSILDEARKIIKEVIHGE